MHTVLAFFRIQMVKQMSSTLFRFLIIAALFLSVPALAQDGGQGGDGGRGGGSGSMGMPGGGSGAGLSNGFTKKLVRSLRVDFNRCQRVKRVYRFDCYRQAYGLASQKLNGRPAYSEIQNVFDGLNGKLERIVAQNEDPQVPPKRQGLQTYRPIKPAAVPKATAQLEQALDEAETVLLRASTERSQTHYARVAEAINSNKVLLRSAIEWLRGMITRVV